MRTAIPLCVHLAAAIRNTPERRRVSTWRVRKQPPPVLNGVVGDAILEPLSVSIVLTQPSRWSIADLVKSDLPCRRCGRYPPLKNEVEAKPPSARTVCSFRVPAVWNVN